MTSLYLKTSAFARPHEYDESLFLKLFTLESVFENLCFWASKTPVTCGTVAVFGENVSVFENTWLCVDGV